MRLLAAVLLMTGFSATADVIYLKNGDRITGEIKEIWDDSVVIDPAYSGKFKVNLGEIESLKTDRELDIELLDGQKGAFQLVNSNVTGEVVLQSGDKQIKIALTDIKKVVEVEDLFDWDSKIDFSQSISRGNTHSQIANLNGMLAVKWGDHRGLFDINTVREERDGSKLKDQDRLNVAYNWIFYESWFFAVNLTLERDPVALLDERTSLNPAIGYDIWDDPGRSLNVQLGGCFQNEIIDEQKENGALVDWRLRYSQEFDGGNFEFFHNHHIYRNLSGRKNLVFNSVTGVRYDITDDIFLNIQLNYDMDSEPAEGTEGEDLTFLFGAGIDL